MTPKEKKAEFNKLAPAAINEVAGLIDGNFAGFQKAQKDYRSQLPVGDPRLLEPAVIPADFLSEEGMKQRGLLDEKGEATKLGSDYLFMEDEGFMKNGKLTEKGMAYTADPDELLPVSEVNDWTILTNSFDVDKDGKFSDPDVESKYQQFQIRKKEGLDEAKGGNFFKQLGEGLLSFGRGVYSVTPLPTMKKAVTGEGISPAEEITKRAAVLSGALNIMGDTAVKSVAFVGQPILSDDENDRNDFIVATRVKMNRLATEPEAWDAITGTSVMADAYAKTLENYKKRFGEAGENKLQQELLDAKLVGQIVGDPLNVPIAIATQGVGLLAKVGTLARVSKSVNIANQTSARIARFNAAAPKVAQQLDEATKLNQTLVKQLDDAVKTGQTDIVAKLTPIVANSTKVVDDLTSSATKMQEGLLVNETARTKALTELAEKSKPLDLSRKATAATVKGVEIAAEKLGNAAAATNRFLRAAEKTIGFYGTGRIVTTALGVGTGPIGQTALGSYYASRIGLSVAPTILRKTARFANVVGDELVQMKNSTPFWRRVAANENIGGIGKAMATTLDYASPAARFGVGSVKQGAKLAPALAVYEAINNGGLDDEAMKRVGANALVFGAFARVVGGGKQDLAKRQTGDFYNYRTKQQKLGEDKLAAFDAIPDQTLKQFISTYDSAYPNTWDWQFTREGNSSFDPSSKTITVNVNDKSGFVRALTSHETLHSLTFKHGMDDSIVAKMLGDETRPGLVRDINGNLDKDFRQFYEAYNERLDAQGLPRIGIEDAAVEFFTDNGTAALFDDVVSGKLTKAEVKTPLRRKIEDIFDTVFAATPIVKDLHYKLGGATDVNGNLVMGSGLLADGMRELPEVKAMVRKMYRESAGLPKSPIKPDAMRDAPSSNPKHYKAAKVIDEINKKNVQEGKPLIEGVMIPDENGNGTGKLSDDHFSALEDGDIIKQGGGLELAHIQSTFEADMAGFIDYTPIEQGRSVQTAGKTTNKIKPIDFMVKNGRLYLVAMDITQLGLNINRLQRKAATLGMSRANVLTDIAEMAKLHKRGVSTDGYFKSVGGKDWKNRKNLITAVQGLNTKAQRLTNPAFDKLGMDKQTGTYRTFAYDRIDGFTDLTGDMVIPYGNNAYYTLKANLMPQAPRINVKGEIVRDAADVRLMPQSKSKAEPTRLAKDLAKKYKVPLSKVTGSGKDGTITPNDVRSFLAERDKKFKPLSFQKEPPMAVEPSISDLVGGRVEYDGMRGMIIDENRRPFFSSDNGAVYDLPFNYFTDQSIRQLGIKPLPDFKKTQELVISKMVLDERPALQDIFGGFDKASDLVLEISELGASMVGRGKNAKMVATTPEFDTFVSRVSDEKILAAWEQTEKALTKAQNAKNLTESTKQSVIQKLEGDIRNLEALASAWENWKRKRVPRKVGSEPAKEVRTEVSSAIDKEIERALSIQSAIERKVAKAVSANAPTSPQKIPQIGRMRDNSVATGIAVALGSSGEKRNE
jgi:hypothetical protein